MKAILKRKYIYIEPTPKKDIKQGLWFEIEDLSLPTTLPRYVSDIFAGVSKYKIAQEVIDNKRKITKVWIAHDKE